MRRKRVFFVLLLAIASGLLAGYSVMQYLQERPTALIASEPRRNSEPVVIVTRNVGLGEVLREEDLRVIDWPAGMVPQGYASATNEVIGRGVLSDIRMNEPVLDAKLADVGMGGGLPPLIPTGMRALSVRVDEVIGVAGFVTPQTRVDVILTMNPIGSNDPVSKVILQNIQALAAGQEIQRNEEGEPMLVTVVTVLVTLEEAEKLVLAANQGQIQMALRNTLDLEEVATPGERASRLFVGTVRGGFRPGVRTGATGPAQEESIIEMYRGGVRTLVAY
jgi:pilus assembly protein CpaB